MTYDGGDGTAASLRQPPKPLTVLYETESPKRLGVSFVILSMTAFRQQPRHATYKYASCMVPRHGNTLIQPSLQIRTMRPFYSALPYRSIKACTIATLPPNVHIINQTFSTIQLPEALNKSTTVNLPRGTVAPGPGSGGQTGLPGFRGWSTQFVTQSVASSTISDSIPCLSSSTCLPPH